MSAPAKAHVALISAIAFFGAGVWWGADYELQRQKAALGKVAEQAIKNFRQQVEDGRVAVAALLQDKTSLENRYAILDETHRKLRRLRVPLTVAQPVVPAAPADPGKAAAPGCIQVHVQPEPVLSLFAVRMWNANLTGRDEGAGACRADAAPGDAEAACAQSAGVTFEEAFDNQAANARSCALDRLRYQRLIDYVRKQEAAHAD